MNLSLFELFIITGLAGYRLTLLLNSEAGPGDIFGRLRSFLGVRFDQYSNPYGTNWVSEGILCFYCLSVWIGLGLGALLALAYYTQQTIAFALICFPFAASGIAVYFKKAVG